MDVWLKKQIEAETYADSESQCSEDNAGHFQKTY